MAEIDCTLVLNIIIVLVLVWIAYKTLYRGSWDNERERRHKHHHHHQHNQQQYQDDRIVLYFGRPTCPHCRRFDPTWEEFQGVTQGIIRTQKINCDDPQNREVCEWARDELGLKGVPFVVMIDADRRRKAVFRGERTVQGLLEFAQQP